MDEPARRRRRVRHVPVEPTPAPPPGHTAATPSAAESASEPTATWAADAADSSAVERGLRGLVGGGSSQVSPTAALRARDAARPRPEDLTRAEEELTIVRRHWVPRD